VCDDADVMEDDPTCGETVDARHLALAVEVFETLAHPDRLRLILALGRDELSLNHLADITEQSPAAVQQHLTSLERIGVVRWRRYHDRPFYHLSEPTVGRLIRRHVRGAGEVAGGTHCTGSLGQGQLQPRSGTSVRDRSTALTADHDRAAVPVPMPSGTSGSADRSRPGSRERSQGPQREMK
jgi:DNA-binding transcriptional ArsR family regulator